MDGVVGGRTVAVGVWRALVAVALALLLAAAATMWFRADDFLFLSMVQRPEFDLWNVLWPVRDRLWWAYRPLGVELYFTAMTGLFGVAALPHHLVSLACHGLNAWLTARLGRRLGLAVWPARLAAFAYLVSYPMMTAFIRPSTFHYRLATALLLACLLWFESGLRTGERGARALALAAFCAGLFTNRLVLLAVPQVFALVLLRAPRPLSGAAPWLAATRASLPFAGLGLGAWLVDRFVFASTPPHRWYGVFLDADLPERVVTLAGLLVGAWPGAWLVLAAVPWLAIVRWRGARGGATDARGAGPALGFAGLWLLAALTAAAIHLKVPTARFLFPAMAPYALVLGAGLQALVPARHHPWAVPLACALLLPWAALWERAAHPSDDHLRATHALVASRNPGLARPMVLEYGGPGLATPEDLVHYRFLTFGFSHLRLVNPARQLPLQLRDLGDQSAPPPEGALVLQLQPNLTVVERGPARPSGRSMDR